MDLSFTAKEQAFAEDVRAWLAANLELPPRFESLDDEIEWGRAWQAKLAAGRWVGIHWPAEYGGRGASPVQVAIFNMEYARSRALQPVNRVGINLAGPTLLAHGTEEQKQRWLPPILDARELWCQLFSEPGAGSDLASLRTRAVRDEGGWLLSGQKVWTSYARHARWGICLARTDPDAPPHRGIGCFLVDMRSRGIEVRPLRELTGTAMFNEVFLTDVVVPDGCVVGSPTAGWACARTTLANERVSMASGSSFGPGVAALFDLAGTEGVTDDPLVRDLLGRLVVDAHAVAALGLRTTLRAVGGAQPGPEASVRKLAAAEHDQAVPDG